MVYLRLNRKQGRKVPRNQLEKVGLGNLKTVGNYLKELENQEFLKSEQVGKEKLYLNFKLLEVLRGK